MPRLRPSTAYDYTADRHEPKQKRGGRYDRSFETFMAFETGERARPTHLEDLPLSERDLEVLQGLANDKLLKEIGRDLGIVRFTVDEHRKRIYRKLDVHTKAGAVAEGFRRGLLH